MAEADTTSSEGTKIIDYFPEYTPDTFIMILHCSLISSKKDCSKPVLQEQWSILTAKNYFSLVYIYSFQMLIQPLVKLQQLLTTFQSTPDTIMKFHYSILSSKLHCSKLVLQE